MAAANASPIVDYYAVLNLPTSADLAGVESAYARISDELVQLGRFDDEHTRALDAVNQAYSVLSHPALRRDYDAVFLARERAEEARRQLALERRSAIKYRMLFGALLVVVVGQAALLGYVAREPLRSVAGSVFGTSSSQSTDGEP